MYENKRRSTNCCEKTEERKHTHTTKNTKSKYHLLNLLIRAAAAAPQSLPAAAASIRQQKKNRKSIKGPVHNFNNCLKDVNKKYFSKTLIEEQKAKRPPRKLKT